MEKRSEQGYTLIELMVSISIITVVLGMLYLYNGQGWKLYTKSYNKAVLQVNGRSALERIANDIKQASSKHIFVGTGFNPDVPLPDRASFSKPYIYFAKPNFDTKKSTADSEASIIDKINKVKVNSFGDNTIVSYDYYLYYVAPVAPEENSRQEPIDTSKRAKMKLLKIKNQDSEYTQHNIKPWPFMPPDLLENIDEEDKAKILSETSMLKDIERQDVSAEFSPYQSNFTFGFRSESPNLFQIKINMYDQRSDTRVSFETSVSPRN